jgi:hypothetical protein
MDRFIDFSPSLPFAFLFIFFCMLAFFAILFLQSGIDKVTDRQGNLDWLTGHFSKSPLANQVPLLLTILTGMELLSGALCAVNAILIFFLKPKGFPLPFITMVLVMLTLLALFAGQRLAKDYTGAAGIVPYFLVGFFATMMSAIYIAF